MKKTKDRKLTKKKAQTLFKNRLGSDTTIPVPEPYECWIRYFMDKQSPPKPYRSWPELRAYEYSNRLVDAQYEPFKVPYTIRREANYIPDLYFQHDGIQYIGEVKGRFRTAEEGKKYIDIRRCHPDTHIFFILEKPKTPLFGAKKRKDGSRRTMEEWMDKHGFDYTYVNELEGYIKSIIGIC